VELVFGPSVTNPLTPLREEMSDGNLGSYTVDRQLDVNPSMSNTTLPLCSFLSWMLHDCNDCAFVHTCRKLHVSLYVHVHDCIFALMPTFICILFSAIL